MEESMELEVLAPRRVLSRVVVVMVLATAAWIVHNQAAPGSAQAACNGVGYPYTAIWTTWADPPAVAYGREESRESCNGNQQYLGKVFDIRTDGSCVYAQFKDGSYTGVQGYSCNSAGYSYTFNDQNGDSYAGYRLYTTYYVPPGYQGTFGH
jgi:hypothetical protein